MKTPNPLEPLEAQPQPFVPMSNNQLRNIGQDAKNHSKVASKRSCWYLAWEVIPMLIDQLRKAYQRITTLEEAQRWRLPDPVTGEWKDLPEVGRDLELTLKYPRCTPLTRFGEFHSGGVWVDEDCLDYIDAEFVAAWRYRAAPYTPPVGIRENESQ